jgi:four helix bundle protein
MSLRECCGKRIRQPDCKGGTAVRRYGGTAVRRYGGTAVENKIGARRPEPLPSGMVPYERFDAWKIAHQLALDVYTVTDSWPANEKYGLIAQIRRAAISAPTNIAEGSAKRGPRELRRYLDITLGSLSEVSYLLRFTRDRGILNDQDFRALDDLRNRAGQLTWRLYASLETAPR